MKNFIRNNLRRLFLKLFPEFKTLLQFEPDIQNIITLNRHNSFSKNARIDRPFRIYNSSIDSFSYVSVNSRISFTVIGKFCSIGPNFLCGWGIHPVNGISTSPTFYSSHSYNGFSLTATDKIEERKPVSIGNDVFIGANVTILDGVNISDGAIIAAGSVVTTDIPAFAIAVGAPAKIIKYRYDPETIIELLKIKWWEWNPERLQSVEEHFFNVSEFIKLNK